MQKISDRDKQKIITLYHSGLGAKEIGEKIDCSIHAVYYFMRKHNIKRRSNTASARVRFDQKPPSFFIPTELSATQERLKLLGTTLYWAEGYKTEKSAGIDFANSDVSMTLIFLQFLRAVCHVNESRLRVLLYSHDIEKIDQQISYWSKLLRIPKSQFTKPYIAQSSGGLEKKSKMPYGLVHLRYADKKLLWQVLQWIEELKH